MKSCVLVTLLCACLVSAYDDDDESTCGSALECAIYNDEVDVVNAMISNNSEILNEKVNGDLPIHFAAAHSKERMVKLLIDSKPEMIDVKNYEKRTPLGVLARETIGTENLMKYLISKGADVNAKDKDERSPLHLCAIAGNTDCVQFLIDHKADVNAMESKKHVALHFAAEKGYDILAKYLIDSKANVNVKNWYDQTPLHFSARNGIKNSRNLWIDNGIRRSRLTPQFDRESKAAVSESEQGQDNIAKMLINKGAVINATDSFGYTPLHWAAAHDRLNITNFLIAAGANVNAIAHDGKKSPLHMVMVHDAVDVAKILLENGAEVNAKAEHNELPIHMAAKKGYTNLVELFLDHNADVNAKDSSGKTALDLARMHGHSGIVTLLMKKQTEVNASDAENEILTNSTRDIDPA